ncbi:MAG TPA: hypothetical protein VEB21_03025, partial [Terriglobales bacterium]|nr:hypothetical protein [Terriglobales bacterium]
MQLRLVPLQDGGPAEAPEPVAGDWRDEARRALLAGAVLIGQLAAAAGSGILIARVFPPVAQGWLALVALVPLIRALEGASAGRALWLGWLTGICACAAAFDWLLPTVIRFQDLEPSHGTLIFAGFVAYHALQFALFA